MTMKNDGFPYNSKAFTEKRSLLQKRHQNLNLNMYINKVCV